MGSVYRANDSRLHRQVAIKVSAERFSDRFEREARAVAALNHQNVCTLFDIGPNYLVMELIEGETLAEHLKQGPMPLDESITVAKWITSAVEAAHERGITRHDLKPGNVILRHDGTVEVLDGRWKAPHEAGLIMGTAGYMAPERRRHTAVLVANRARVVLPGGRSDHDRELLSERRRVAGG